MSLESTVGVAKVGTKSLRATVPEGIVAFLEIKEGDKLQWKMDTKDNDRIVIVKKKGTELHEATKTALKYSKIKERH
jgi:bifunctional DNA-binding transcriptional regulator/antitoxin component of YhaV-PrlF toxin-antitoxin module